MAEIDVVELEALTSWGTEGKTIKTTPNPLQEDIPEPKFPVDDDINSKIYLWEGKLWKVRADVIVNTTNESMTDRNGISGQIHEHAGSQLEEEVLQAETCRTGECRMTRAYLLPCKKIVHTVGPRYNERYKTAAESALHYCYRNSMELTMEAKLHSIALCCVYTERKGYPRKEAAHIAVRTVRRFMEQFRDGLSHVIFCVDNLKDLEIYRELLRQYFPRNTEDLAFQNENLPKDIGNDKGEPVLEERQVRISAMPGRPAEDEEENFPSQNGNRDSVTEQLAESESFATFSSMTTAPDAQRLAGSREPQPSLGGWAAVPATSTEEQYEKYLRKALATDLSSVSRHNFIYKSGRDNAGRQVFVLVAQNFPAREVEDDKAILHIINVMDSAVHLPYTLVYVHSNFSVALNQPLPALMQKVYEVLDRRYKKNIKQLVVVHPSVSSRTLLLGLRAVLSPKFWNKVVYCDKVADLYNYMRREQVVLPDLVQQYEKEQENSILNSMNTLFSW